SFGDPPVGGEPVFAVEGAGPPEAERSRVARRELTRIVSPSPGYSPLLESGERTPMVCPTLNDRIDPAGWLSAPQEREQLLAGRALPFRDHLDPAVGQVRRGPGESQLQRARTHPPPEAHTLHASTHPRGHTNVTHRLPLLTSDRPHGTRGSHARVTRFRLAPRTTVRRAVHERLPPDRRAAAGTRAVPAPVGVEAAFEVAALPVDVHVEAVEGRPALGQRRDHHLADRGEQR